MKKKRWLCLFTVMVVSMLLSLSALAAPSTDHSYRGTVDQIYLAIHDQEGEWPAEPSIADHKYLFLKKSGSSVISGGSGSVQFDTAASTYIDTDVFQSLYRASVKTSGSDGGNVTGLSKPTGMDGTEGFWTQNGFSTLTSLKNDIIRAYLQNRTSDTKIEDPTAAQIAEYDVLIYVVKYEEYYTSSGEIYYGNSGYHVDCAVVKKSSVKLVYDANLPSGYSVADGIGLPNNKTVSQNTAGITLDDLSYSSVDLRGKEIQNESGLTGAFLGWSLDKSTVVTQIDVGTTDVTVHALWKIEDPDQPDGINVQKTVKSVGGVAVTQDDDGNPVIPTAYPGYEIVWEITVENTGDKETAFTLTDAMLEHGAKVYDANGDPVVVSETLWTDTIPANETYTYIVKYTLQASDLTDGIIVNSVVLDNNGEEVPAEPVITSAYPVYVYFKTLLVREDATEESIQLSDVDYTGIDGGNVAVLGWISDLLLEQPTNTYSDLNYESGFQVAKSAVGGENFTAYEKNSAWLSYVQWESLTSVCGADGFGDTPIVAEPEAGLTWHLNGSVRLCELTYDENADDVSYVPESAYLVQNTASQISNTIPYRAGFIFAGWNTQADGNGTVYAAGDVITLSTSDTLYAQWKEQAASFDLNDVDGSAAIRKYLSGNPSSSYKETFSVTLTAVYPNTTSQNTEYEVGNTITGSAEIDADTLTSDFLFAENEHILTFDKAGVYYYLVQEVNGSRSRVTYDDTAYTLVITVSQTEGDVLEIADWAFCAEDKEVIGAHLTITNIYTASSGGGDGIIRPSEKKYLNTEDHFAYIVGYADNTVRPNNSITRAEVATIFFRLLNDDVRQENLSRSNSFTDVNHGDWYNTAISTMAALGILDGYSDGTFRPNEPITRAEFAAIAARFDENTTSGSASFSDLTGHWAASEISKAYKNGWVTGYSDGTFRPDQAITRAEAVTLINRVLERELPDGAALLDDMNVWIDNLDSGKWYYLDIQEATNSHTYTRDKNDIESWVKMRTDPDWTSYED